MSRLQGILAAGGLTGIVLASSLALGGGVLNQQSEPTPEVTEEATIEVRKVAPLVAQPPAPTPTPIVIHKPAPVTVQDELYKAQIEAANATIQQLEQQLADQQAAAAAAAAVDNGGGGGGRRDDDHEEHEDREDHDEREGGDD